MSDVGLYDALEAELYAALTTPAISGAATVAKTLSIQDLVERDAVRKPAIGIVDSGARFREPYGVGQRIVGVVSRWEIGVVVQNQRGAISGRPTLRGFLETVRDRVHNLKTATSSRAAWRWQSDEYIDQPREDLVAAVATFEINVNFGI